MYRSLLSVFAFIAFLGASAQSYVHQVFVLNEGYYDMNTSTQVVPVSLGSYDPVSSTYQTVANITGPRFASDVEVRDGAVFVAADDQLLKYDANTYALLDQVTVPGIRQLALWNNKVLLTRGELGGLPHYFEVRDAATLALNYAVTPADGLLYSAEDVEVVGDRAYLAVGNAFDWNNLVGKVVAIDLPLGTYESEVDLGPNGLNPENIMVNGTDLFVLNNKDFTGSSISRVSVGNASLTYTNNVALNSGCGASVLADDHIYYMEYAVDRLARYSVNTDAVADTLTASVSPYGLIADPVNGVLYGTTTDFFSSGELHTMALDGTVLSTVAVGVSPGRLALDVRSITGIADKDAPVLGLFPNPAVDQLQVALTTNKVSNENITLTIIDLNGQVIYQRIISADQVRTTVDVANLPAGTYFLRSNDGKQVITKRFIKA